MTGEGEGSHGTFRRRQFLQTTAVGVGSIAGVGHVHGQQETATEIEDWHDLDAVRDALDEEYVVVADLDETTAGYDEKVADPDGGWAPLGTSSDPFRGALDGNGYEIVALRISRPDEDNIGLFGGVVSGQISNLGVEECQVTGRENVGGIVGNGMEARVIDSFATGTVRGDTNVGGIAGYNRNMDRIDQSFAAVAVTGEENVGGIVGKQAVDSIVSKSYSSSVVTGGSSVGGVAGEHGMGWIRESWNTGTVSGEVMVGGLIGSMPSTGEVNNTYSTGSVTGSESVGGLIGRVFDGIVRYSYATGDVSGEENVGGLTGDIGISTLMQAYAAGEVTGAQRVGGLVGRSESPLVTAGYWDVPATGQEESPVGTGLGDIGDQPPAEEMTGDDAPENMVGFDFTEIWNTVVDPDDYPVLVVFDEEPSVADYANEEGIIDTDGLREAASDWRTGEIDTELLREVVDYWRTGDPVE